MGHTKAMSAQTKVGILHRIWAGEKVARVARECGISRQVIYTWRKKADRALCQALQEKKRGPKAQHRGEVKDDGNVSQVLSSQRDPSLSLYGYSSEVDLSTVPKAEPKQGKERPEQCPVCGCEKIYRNGTYTVRNRSTTQGGQRRKVQRYICVWCKSSICVH